MLSRVIDDEQAARRLARAIVADIRLYHEAEIAAGDVSEALGEGRALFHARVVGSLHRVFEEEASALPSQARSEEAPASPMAKPADPFASFHQPLVPPPRASPAALIAVMIAVVGIALGLALSLR
jgi:hypothetical protein